MAFAVITDQGRQRLREAAPTYMEGIRQRFTRHLATDELAAVGDALWRVRGRAAGRACDRACAETGRRVRS